MLKHVVNSSDLDKTAYDWINARSEEFISKGIDPTLMAGKIVATLFFQPSTRTMNAFQSGMLRGGGGWIGVTSEEGLSMAKGESFEDTIRTYGGYADCIVLRHPDDDSAERAAKVSFVPIINGGSGSREHAIGAAFMLGSLNHYFGGKLDGLKVGIYGTPEINRACKALLPIFGMYGMSVVVDDLGHFPFPKDVEEKAKQNGMKDIRYDKLENFISDVDLLIVTRAMQKGIISDDKFPKERAEIIMNNFKPISVEDMKKLKKDAFLFMITPRIFEVDLDVDPDPRAIHSKKDVFAEISLAIMEYILKK